jgi:hypothetical protein
MILGGNLGQRFLVDRSKQASGADQRHGRRILGQEHVCRRAVAFLDDLVGELHVAALADGDLDAGILGETFGPLGAETFVLCIVDHDAFGILCKGAACECGRGEKNCGRGQLQADGCLHVVLPIGAKPSANGLKFSVAMNWLAHVFESWWSEDPQNYSNTLHLSRAFGHGHAD